MTKQLRARFLMANDRERIIIKQAKRNKSIVYGAQSVNRQLNPFIQRRTFDYDIFASKPKRSAKQLERSFERKSGVDFWYVKPALHKGTYKVMYAGADARQKTKDDIGVADYTKLERGTKYKVIRGVRYSTIAQERANRLRSLRDKEFRFRHAKDRNDLRLMRAQQNLRRAGLK